MKKLYNYIIILFCSINFLTAQSPDLLERRVDSLNSELTEVDAQIFELNKRKSVLKSQIIDIGQEISKLELDNELIEGIPTAITSMGGTLRDQPSITGNVIIKVKEGDSIIIYNSYQKPYFKALYKDMIGFISYSALIKNPKIESIINEEIAEDNPKLARLIKKYGLGIANKLMERKYWVGMDKEMALISLGTPKDINKSVGSWGVHEQWVYGNKNLYFENGTLTSYQD